MERCHHTIKHIAAWLGCSIVEALYWYNRMPKDDTTALSVSANSIYNHQACIKGIDVTSPFEHTDPGIYRLEDAV